MTDKEKLLLYVDQLISKGNKEIDELSKFDKKISTEQADKITDFQLQELNKISSCRTALVLFFGNLEGRDKIKTLNEKLDDYQKKVQYFAYQFPLEN